MIKIPLSLSKLTALTAACLLSLVSLSNKAEAAPQNFGVNIPWVNYGADFGEDFYHPGYGPTYNASQVQGFLDNIKSKRMNMVRMWVMEDLCGLTFQNNNADQPCTGVSQTLINNLVDFVKRANARGINVYVTFLTFQDVQKHPNIITTYRSNFINNALVPVARALSPYSVQFDLMNECNYSNRSWSELRGYGRAAATAIKAVSPHWITMTTDNSSALTNSFSTTLGGLGFNFYDCHRYSTDSSPLLVTPSNVGNAPLFVGEYGPDPSNGWYGTLNGVRVYTDAQNQSTVDHFCNDAANKGYRGMLAWSYLGGGFKLQNSHAIDVMSFYGNQWGINP